MSRASAVSTRSLVPTRARRLSAAAAFYLLGSITVSFLAGSSAPTPLYPLYQAQWGLSSTAVTLIFGIYALALLGALLITGRLSDHLGRRPVLMVATMAQAVTMILFATAGGLPSLLVARVIQGLSTGAAVAAVGAGMLDLDKVRGALANAVAPPLGTATGAVAAGLTVHYLPAPTHLIYLVLGAIFILQGVGVALTTETNAPRRGALASLEPQFKLPDAARGPLLFAVPVLVASWALAGFYASLGPALMHGVFGLDSSLLGGLALFVLAGSGAISILLFRRHEPRRMMSLGATALVAGVAVVLAAVSFYSAIAFFVGTAIAGMGFGMGFQGAVRTVVPFAAAHERAGVLSVIFVASYLAMGVPAVIAGYLVAHQSNLPLTAQEFGAVVMVLAAIAALGAATRQSKRLAC